jgi:hypothetical protein
MSVATFRTALATTLRTIPGLRASEYMTDEIVVPHAMFDYEIEPHLVFARGADVYRFTVQVFTSRSSDVASQKFLDLLRDPTTSTGLTQTVEDSASLAAVCDYAQVKSIGKIELAQVGGVEYLMVPFEIEVVL